MKLIDTNLLIYSQHKEHDFLKVLFFSIPFENAISAISKIESLGYVDITLEEKNYIEKVTNNLQVFPITDEIIDVAISIKQNKKMSLGDSIIAATALHHNIALYTRNTNDFKHIDKLVLVNPFEK
jgi:predicted nucleic acid-binding protein